MIITSFFLCVASLVVSTVSSAIDFTELTSSEPKYASPTVLDRGDTEYFNFTIPSGDDVDVRVRLSVYSGDADVYVLKPDDDDDILPSSDAYDFHSEHARGDDVIFISRYVLKELRENTFNGESLAGKYFRVAVEGWAAHGSEYAIEFEAFTNPRSLSDRHKTALGVIFDECCSSEESLCKKWRKGDAHAGSGKELDLCHFDGNICDEDGNLEEFDARQLFEFNREQTEDNCEFPSDALKKLMTPSMRRFQMTGFYQEGSYKNIFKEVTLANVADIFEASKSANKLEHFDMAELGVTGRLDVHLGVECDKLPLSLHTMNIQGNRITGTIKKCMLEKLHVLIVQDNDLTGALPELDDPENSNVTVLNANENELEGALPASLVNGNFAKNLTHLALSKNKLSGELPDEWDVPKLRALYMEHNLFTGELPATLGSNSPNLQIIRIGDNAFNGTIPKGLCDDEARAEVSLENNKLNSGGIPTSVYENDTTGNYSSGKNLISLDVSNNTLNGNIPVWIQQAPKLKYLNLQNNKLSGNLPQRDANWPSLIQFSARNNEFVGKMPDKLHFGATFRTKPTLIDNQYYIIHYADVRNNFLTGQAPSWVGEYKGSQIQFARITGNIFDCEIPSELEYLNLDCREENGSIRYAVNKNDEVAGNGEAANIEKEDNVGWLGRKGSARRVVLIGFMVFLCITLMYWIYVGIIRQWLKHMQDVRRDRALGGRFWELEEEYQEYNRAIMESRQMATANENNSSYAELTPYVVNNNNTALAASAQTSSSTINNTNQNPFRDSSPQQNHGDTSSDSESSPGHTRRGRSRNEHERLSERARRNLMRAERVGVESSSPSSSLDSSFRGRDGLFGP